MSPRRVRIFIPLLDEGVPVVRPTLGDEIEENVIKIVPTEGYDPEDEHWAFTPGQIVRCVVEVWEGQEILVAREEYRQGPN